jgi:hypothetical protein
MSWRARVSAHATVRTACGRWHGPAAGRHAASTRGQSRGCAARCTLLCRRIPDAGYRPGRYGMTAGGGGVVVAGGSRRRGGGTRRQTYIGAAAGQEHWGQAGPRRPCPPGPPLLLPMYGVDAIWPGRGLPASQGGLERAMRGHVLVQARLAGPEQRRSNGRSAQRCWFLLVRRLPLSAGASPASASCC